MKKIKNNVKINKSDDNNSEYIIQLKKEISDLKDELACYDIIHSIYNNNKIIQFNHMNHIQKKKEKH